MLLRQSVVINEDSTGSSALVAGATGVTIRVLGYVFVAAGTVTVQFASAATPLTGAMPAIAGVPVSAMAPAGFPADMALFQTAKGEALNIVLGGNVQVSGHLLIEKVS